MASQALRGLQPSLRLVPAGPRPRMILDFVVSELWDPVARGRFAMEEGLPRPLQGRQGCRWGPLRMAQAVQGAFRRALSSRSAFAWHEYPDDLGVYLVGPGEDEGASLS